MICLVFLLCWVFVGVDFVCNVDIEDIKCLKIKFY